MRNPAGTTALARLTAPLAAVAGGRLKVTVQVLDRHEVNAVAFPDGSIFVFRGLLEEIATAEALSGVLAHELAHVSLRHSMQHIFYSEVVNLFATLLTGQSGLDQLTAMVAQTSYSRDVERAADREAARILLAVGQSPRGLQAFLRQMQEKETPADATATQEKNTPDPLAYLGSHPATPERIAALEALIPKDYPPAPPLLSKAEWRALRTMCRGEGDAQKKDRPE